MFAQIIKRTHSSFSQCSMLLYLRLFKPLSSLVLLNVTVVFVLHANCSLATVGSVSQKPHNEKTASTRSTCLLHNNPTPVGLISCTYSWDGQISPVTVIINIYVNFLWSLNYWKMSEWKQWLRLIEPRSTEAYLACWCNRQMSTQLLYNYDWPTVTTRSWTRSMEHGYSFLNC